MGKVTIDSIQIETHNDSANAVNKPRVIVKSSEKFKQNGSLKTLPAN